MWNEALGRGWGKLLIFPQSLLFNKCYSYAVWQRQTDLEPEFRNPNSNSDTALNIYFFKNVACGNYTNQITTDKLSDVFFDRP